MPRTKKKAASTRSTKTTTTSTTTTPTATEVAREAPAGCTACGSTDLEVVKKIGEHVYAGRLPDGKPYTSISRRRVKCRACGQHQIKQTHHFDPKRWSAGADAAG